MCLEVSAEAHMKSWVFRGLRPEVLEFKALSEQHSETLAQEINVLNSLLSIHILLYVAVLSCGDQ